jgi:N-methylhydantoinase A
MGLSTIGAALGILEVANANIDRALRRVSVARGYDPRAFTLLAFGGAGPLHACAVAERLSIPRVLVPRHPGVLCAFGLLMADVVLAYSHSVLGPLDEGTPARLRRHLDGMQAHARADLEREGIPSHAMAFEGLVDARYRGQSYELTIPFADDLAAAFHAAHTAAYGHAMPERTVEVVTLRLQATGRVEKPALPFVPPEENDGAEARLEDAPVVCRAGLRPVARYERDRLRPGASFDGPALIFQFDSTTFLPVGWSAHVDGYHNLVLAHDAAT